MQPRMGNCSNTSPELEETMNMEAFSTGTGQSRGSSLGTDQQSQSDPITGLHLTPDSPPKETSAIYHILEQEGVDLDEMTRLQLLRKKITLQSILKSGVKAVLGETSSEIVCTTSHGIGEGSATNCTQLRADKLLVLQNASNEYAASLPDIRRNHIRIKQVLFVAACVANASTLGITIVTPDCDDLESPFFRDNLSETSAKTACLNEFAHVRTCLRPCATQLMHRHHPYIDMLPFPTFRERVIKLACAEEPMIDEDDLCKDLSENDGLICWGSALGGGSAVTGTGTPWDSRSWEAQPWFLRKWWILIGGKDGEIYKQTQWWCEMRGERSCYPW
ncbi:hypothetical protein BDZ45DRAFT_372188 [Acephala macrosclerotiorum]|nr:hypothetical protein BDZ45DRAFT_372188 [Acephala macrosclerotiorum]